MNNEEYIVDLLPTDDRHSLTGSASANGSTSGGTLNSIVDNAFRQLLGQGASTTTDFDKALKTAFVAKKDGNRTEYEWQPNTYVSNADTLGGGVTGAQASLYYRAKAILNDVLRLLDTLKPLDPAADQENSQAARAIVRTEMMELVQELGLPGGPRVQRVDHYFQRLLREQPMVENGGSLQQLEHVLGLNLRRINTITEEENYSNYLILRDYIVSLRESWNTYKVDEMQGAYLGPRLVDLERVLAVIGESVRETYRLMNRYFLGPEERRSVRFNFLQAGQTMEDSESGALLLTLLRNASEADDNMTIRRLLNVWDISPISLNVSDSALVDLDDLIINATVPQILDNPRIREARNNLWDKLDIREFSLPDGKGTRYRFFSAVEPSGSDLFDSLLVDLVGQPFLIGIDDSPILPPYYAPTLNQPMTVAELLDWVLEFATQEGPMLVRSGGKLGIDNALEEKAFILTVLVQAAAIAPNSNSAFEREGVKRSLSDLAAQLYEVKRLAEDIQSPLRPEA